MANRPTSGLRRIRIAGALAMPMLLGCIGCATLDRGQSLIPTKHQVRTGQFILLSNFPMTSDAPAVRCLEALERNMGQHMGFRPPASDNPVEIYVLDDRMHSSISSNSITPSSRLCCAFFLAQGEDRVVYTYSNPRLEEDLRHEATHALLHGAFGDLPLWLDEGLAEDFENDLAAHNPEPGRLDQIAADLRGGWTPNLERLESLTDIRQMSPRDYREAWGWVHLFLDGSESGKSIVMGYLRETDRAGDKARLRPRLVQTHLTDDRMLAHLKTLEAGMIASEPVRESNSVRLQDRPIDPLPPSAPRGIFHKFRAWLKL